MKSFKRVMALLLALSVIAAYASFEAYASGNTTIKIGEVEGEVNETVDVPITISNNTAISGFLFAVSYNTDALEILSVEIGKDLSAGTLTDNLSDNEHTSLHIMWYSADEFTGNGEVAVIKIKIKTTELKTYSLAVKYNAKDIRNSTSQIEAEVLAGSVKTIPHNYKSTWSKDGTQHWHECSVCGDKKDVANHVYDNDCDTTCNECGETRTVMPHVYTNEQDTTCNECGHVRKVLSDACDSSQWYYSAVNYCVENKYMNGYGGTSKFGIADNIQRQDFVVILANYCGANLSAYNKASKFGDVPYGQYYTAAVNWASSNGIVNGYANGNFGVGDAMTREQLVTMLYNFAKNYLKKDVTANGVKARSMTDYNQVSGWAKSPVEWAIDKGAIGGKSGIYIAPGANAQRCEIAAIIKNLDDKSILK